MKPITIFSICCFIILLFTISIASASKNYDCDEHDCTKLVGLWHLDDDAITDSGPNKKHGTPVGGLKCQGKKGKINDACEFDGQTQIVTIENDLLLGLSSIQNPVLSISLWIRPLTLEGKHDIVVQYKDTQVSGQDNDKHKSLKDVAYQLIQKDDKIEFIVGYDRRYESDDDELEDDAVTEASRKKLKSRQSIKLDEWTHIVVIVDEEGIIQIYINGILDEKTLELKHPRTENYGPLYLGGNPADEKSLFIGKIDEFLIFDRVLTPDEIAFLYDLGTFPRAENFDPNYGSTDFSQLSDWTTIPGLVLANADGKIVWEWTTQNAADQDFDSNVIIGSHFVSVNVNQLGPSYNVQTRVIIENVICPTTIYYADGAFNSAQEIVSQGTICPPTICMDIVCSGSTLSFTAAHFTGFASLGGTSLKIFDEIESGGLKKPLESIMFFANYSNATTGMKIPGAECNISFDDGESSTMIEADVYYNYTKAAGFVASGYHYWNVTCAKTGYTTLNVTDTILISHLSSPEFGFYAMIIAVSISMMGFIYFRRPKI